MLNLTIKVWDSSNRYHLPASKKFFPWRVAVHLGGYDGHEGKTKNWRHTSLHLCCSGTAKGQASHILSTWPWRLFCRLLTSTCCLKWWDWESQKMLCSPPRGPSKKFPFKFRVTISISTSHLSFSKTFQNAYKILLEKIETVTKAVSCQGQNDFPHWRSS